MRLLPLLAASLLTTCLSAAGASAAASGEIIEVTGPTIIGFFPPQSDPEEDDGGGYSEGIAHLRFAIEVTAACLRDLKPTLRLEVAKTLKVRHGGEEHTFRLPPDWPASAGAYLFAPGKPPRAVHATVGASSMSFHLPNAAAEYFGVLACKKELLSGPPSNKNLQLTTNSSVQLSRGTILASGRCASALTVSAVRCS